MIRDNPTPGPAKAAADHTIRAILTGSRTIAVVGASPKPERPANIVMRYLIAAGYRVVPVNPGHAGDEILGRPAFGRLADVPVPIDVVDVFRRREALGAVVDEALALKPLPKVIWMQLGLRDDDAASRAEAAGLTVVMDRCMRIEHRRLG